MRVVMSSRLLASAESSERSASIGRQVCPPIHFGAVTGSGYRRDVLRRLDLRGTDTADARALRHHLPRPEVHAEPPVEQVRAVLDEVRTDGDAALRRLTERFDGARIDALRVPPDEVAAAVDAIPADLRAALEAAHANVWAYHATQVGPETTHHNGGVTVRELVRPVDRAGCYVPTAAAPLVSSVIMTAVPAKVAGVPEVVLCTSPGPDGQVVPGVLAAFAGPSEVVVIADRTVPAEHVAVDVILQAEHGPEGLAWLVTWDEAVADAVTEAVARLVPASPRRAHLERTLSEAGWAVVTDGPAAAMAVSDAIAPEHLELLVDDPEALLPLVHHAGAVFCGALSPASIGDYVAGPNHVLPTSGSARFSGALRVDDFRKHVHVVTVDRQGLDEVADHVVALATYEGLPAHADAVRLRRQQVPTP